MLPRQPLRNIQRVARLERVPGDATDQVTLRTVPGVVQLGRGNDAHLLGYHIRFRLVTCTAYRTTAPGASYTTSDNARSCAGVVVPYPKNSR